MVGYMLLHELHAYMPYREQSKGEGSSPKPVQRFGTWRCSPDIDVGHSSTLCRKY